MKSFVQQRRQIDKSAHLNQQNSQEGATDAQATAVADAAAAKAARAAAEKQVCLFQLMHSLTLNNSRYQQFSRLKAQTALPLQVAQALTAIMLIFKLHD